MVRSLPALAVVAVIGAAGANAAGVDAIAADRYQVDARGGVVIRPEGFDLSRPGARWTGNGTVEMVYEPHGDRGCYRMVIRKEGYWMGMSVGRFPLKPNRDYVLSLLIRTDFDRANEINAGMRTTDARRQSILYNLNGLPARTDGWQRWEYRFTAYADPETAVNGQFYFRPFGFKGQKEVSFRIADAAFIELPPEPLRPFAKGEGVTFAGGPGALPMCVAGVKQNGTRVEVRATGALYTFDGESNTIEAHQLLERERVVARWHSSLPLGGLAVLSQTPEVCVLSNDAITIGIQCDSMAVIAPHQEIALTCRGAIGGRWNRLAAGHLVLVDDHGGMAVNPHIPSGTGRLPRVDAVAGDMQEPGWSARWTISPGERLGLSLFPPRPFDWERSFKFSYTLTHPGIKLETYSSYKGLVDTVLLWNSFCRSSYGMSYGPRYLLRDEADYRAHVEAIHQAGMQAITYMSPYFYPTQDPREFIQEVRRYRDTYGIDGVYYDGDPSQDWIQAYEAMRLTREAFPEGTVILHTTGQSYNGGPPLARPDVFIPAIDTYATATLRGEFVPGEGRDWDYPRYVTSQYRKANCIGVQKGDRWQGVTQLEQDLINLGYNGRARMMPAYVKADHAAYRDTYYPIWMALKKLWQEKGADPQFHEKHYLPTVKELTRPVLDRAGPDTAPGAAVAR